MLQNCHLAVSWMPRLEAIVEQYDADAMHRDYRLWLTSMPSDKFPVSILQNSVKMTSEPPRGVKANLKLSYVGFTDDYLNAQAAEAEFKKLLFGTCFFHALLQDRRKFGALGFNIRYEFTTGDLKCCILQLENFLARYDHVPYEVLVNLIGHINYGGRITDDWDRRMVMTMLMSIINPASWPTTSPSRRARSYLSPPRATSPRTASVIERLPINPHPNVFGLHENADIACAQDGDAGALRHHALAAAQGGERRRQVRRTSCARRRARCTERNFAPFPMDEVAEYPLTYTESMNTVLAQEAVRYNKLINEYNRSLADLLKALKGLVVMSADLEAMATSLYTNQVPAMWAAVAYPSLKPLAAWIDDLARGSTSSRRGSTTARRRVLGLGFFFPQAFLTGHAAELRAQVRGVDRLGRLRLRGAGEGGGLDIAAKPEDGVLHLRPLPRGRGLGRGGALRWSSRGRRSSTSTSRRDPPLEPEDRPEAADRGRLLVPVLQDDVGALLRAHARGHAVDDGPLDQLCLLVRRRAAWPRARLQRELGAPACADTVSGSGSASCSRFCSCSAAAPECAAAAAHESASRSAHRRAAGVRQHLAQHLGRLRARRAKVAELLGARARPPPPRRARAPAPPPRRARVPARCRKSSASASARCWLAASGSSNAAMRRSRPLPSPPQAPPPCRRRKQQAALPVVDQPAALEGGGSGGEVWRRLVELAGALAAAAAAHDAQLDLLEQAAAGVSSLEAAPALPLRGFFGRASACWRRRRPRRRASRGGGDDGRRSAAITTTWKSVRGCEGGALLNAVSGPRVEAARSVLVLGALKIVRSWPE